MTKYILVSGGVVSGIGKGVIGVLQTAILLIIYVLFFCLQHPLQDCS
jgi:hypothetical protein